ncbi:hypothetical protein CDAR_484371 [Caerostris darwini]|uniref:Uncharacterized protein n=1 Tax=Caerostris darwini TaxID=1538125 RepID=A0AAV4TFD1_9ARAC|nr:hypothetical protein CDAR_484371 [Caerostris darwini]
MLSKAFSHAIFPKSSDDKDDTNGLESETPWLPELSSVCSFGKGNNNKTSGFCSMLEDWEAFFQEIGIGSFSIIQNLAR